MKNIMKSLVIILAAVSVSGGATYSFFSATDSIDGNTISTATVEIDAKGEAGQGVMAKPIATSNLVPGQYTEWARGAVWNKSTVPVRLYMYADNLQGSACPLTNLTMTTGYAGGNERERTVYEGKLTDIAGSVERVELTGNPPFATVPANWTQVVQQRAQLDDEADNGAQNQECTWDEIFVAESVAPTDN
ncbi:MAG: hypothetical protein IPJ67_02135 [Candidatus Moraniibacteriota bacterium]|nr:MAG: hypothetical protein IPJ67_02135 [Candidatus Moranbacteria bacterium]